MAKSNNAKLVNFISLQTGKKCSGKVGILVIIILHRASEMLMGFENILKLIG
jgi:hypothetical protein